MHHHGGKKHSKKKTMRSGVRTRIQAAEEFAESVDNFYASYEAAWKELSPFQREEQRRRIQELIDVCGDEGKLDDPIEYEETVAKGLLPYIDPILLENGIVPSDAVVIHGRCVSRRAMIEQLDRVSDEVRVPNAFDGLRVTLIDMNILDLDPNDYRFFNSSLPRRRPRQEVEYIPPAQDIGDDDDDEMFEDEEDEEDEEGEEGDEEFLTEAEEENLREFRVQEMEDIIDDFHFMMRNPALSYSEFEELLSGEAELSDHLHTANGDRYPVESEFRFPINVHYPESAFDELLTMIVEGFYDDENRQPRRRSTFQQELFLEKIQYLLLEWKDPNNDQHYPFVYSEIMFVLPKAIKHKNIDLLRLLDSFVTLTPAAKIRENRQFYIVEPFRSQLALVETEIQNELDQLQRQANTTAGRQASMQAAFNYSEISSLVQRIQNLINL